jgi:ribosomal protein S26
VRIGSISQGKIKCDSCGRTIPYAERYLIVKETDGVEDDEKGEVRHYCVKCAREKGYTEERQEKSERILTFFQKTERLLEPSEETEEKEEKLEPAEPKGEKEQEPEEDGDD